MTPYQLVVTAISAEHSASIL